MLLSSQRLFSYSPPNLCFPRSSSLSLSINLRYHLSNPTHFPTLNLTSLKPHNFTSSTDPFHLRAYESDSTLQKDALEAQGEKKKRRLIKIVDLEVANASTTVAALPPNILSTTSTEEKGKGKVGEHQSDL